MFSNMEEVKDEDAVYQWGGSKIQLIQFEEFVTSKRRREQLASKIGLDLRNQKEFEHFKPWDSVKNCKLHQTYEDQSEIQLIAEKLSEYCVEPVITKADAALLDAPPERFRHGAGRRQRAKQALKRLRFWA